ncbi:MAG: hypothetical protein QOE90_1823 [Thermoplasmata archaeon]|jgi:hypothetical protein|nr:hypothetical protein [Thermoplasmata archaeon]
MRVLVPVLLALATLAGCLETPAPPADNATAPGTGLGDLARHPDLPVGVLYQDSFGFGPGEGDRRDTFVVPPATDALAFEANLSATTDGADASAVALFAPNGTGMAKCYESPCLQRVESPTPGAWQVSFSGMAGRNGTVTVRVAASSPAPSTPATPPTVTPSPTPPTPASTTYTYARTITFNARTNQTDFLVVLPGATRLRGAVVFENVSSESNYPPAVSVYRRDGGVYTPPCQASCEIDLEAKPGLYLVSYQGNGTGSAYVKIDVEGAPDATGSVDVYMSGHDYASGQLRGPFDEGFLVPPGFSRLEFDVQWGQAHDPASNATIVLRDPAGAEIARCARLDQDVCTIDREGAAPGLWKVEYLGRDSLAGPRTHAKAG